MAISADISDPINDSRGATLPWGKFQQNKEKIVYVFIDVPPGTRGRQVQVNHLCLLLARHENNRGE